MIVSVLTGSTVYTAAAGVSMVHPSVLAIMITSICPHSLSFRLTVVPAGVKLKIMLSSEARNTAWLSFDGWKKQEMNHGGSISISASCSLLPSICVCGPVSGRFESLAQCLLEGSRLTSQRMRTRVRRTARPHFPASNLNPQALGGLPAGLLTGLALTNYMAVRASVSCTPCWESLGEPYEEQVGFLRSLNLFFISKKSKMRTELGVLHLSQEPPKMPGQEFP